MSAHTLFPTRTHTNANIHTQTYTLKHTHSHSHLTHIHTNQPRQQRNGSNPIMIRMRLLSSKMTETSHQISAWRRGVRRKVGRTRVGKGKRRKTMTTLHPWSQLHCEKNARRQGIGGSFLYRFFCRYQGSSGRSRLRVVYCAGEGQLALAREKARGRERVQGLTWKERGRESGGWESNPNKNSARHGGVLL